MSISPVERSAAVIAPVARTPLTALDVLASAVFWIDASLSDISDGGST